MNTHVRFSHLVVAILAVLSAGSHAQEVEEGFQLSAVKKISDISYATVEGIALRLDIYLPVGAENPPLLVWVHGGAWSELTKAAVRPDYLVSHGFAIVSVDFRQSGVAKFPAQIHDIKGAIRFLRANATNYGFDATRIAILGASSGGHLAALAGVTNGNEQLEGEVGDYVDESSDVHAIVSYFGASNLTTILQQSTPSGLEFRVPALEAFLGGQPDELPEVARLASPVYHVDPNDPPILLIHGDQDPYMPINQSHELYGAYQRLGLHPEFTVIYGAAHGGDQFYEDRVSEIVRLFLDIHLQ